MNSVRFCAIIQSQFDAAFAMLEECVRKCPPKQWHGVVAKYPFWQVIYHTLYCTDLYAAKSEDVWQTHPKFHPTGRAEVEKEYPSREFSKRELLAYLRFTKTRVREALAQETTRSLAGPSGLCMDEHHARGDAHLQSASCAAPHGATQCVLTQSQGEPRWQKRDATG